MEFKPEKENKNSEKKNEKASEIHGPTWDKDVCRQSP